MTQHDHPRFDQWPDRGNGRRHGDAPESIRIATALAHSIPGLVLELECCNNDRLIVAHHRLDADMDPCTLRRVVLAQPLCEVPRLLDIILGVGSLSGIQDLGGGVYARSGDNGDERWFATTLDALQVNEVFEACELEIAEQAIAARILPDNCLGVTVVCLTVNHEAERHRLDEVAAWSVAACMVAELIGDLLE